MFAGWFITRSLLARVQRITRTACSLSEQQSFSQRVADKSWGGRDELSILSETFNDMLDQLGRLYHSQQRFIADASHELRAPITSISCNLDLLAKAPDLPAQEARAALADARVEADRMGRLVSDLLTLARADGERHERLAIGVKKARLREQAIDLDSLLLEVFRQYRPAGDSGGDELKRPPRLLLQHITPASVAGNADQLKQALVALVDNALKYTPAQGTVSLALSTAGRWAIVEIRDTGIGIASADVPLIFERFYRADPARSRDQGGSGLGLAIAWSIVQEHGGAIDVESDPAQGSTFALRLPLSQP